MPLSISLLGYYAAQVNGQPLPESRTKKIEALLTYLVVESEYTHRREKLMGLLFPEMPDDTASTNLRQTLTRLRRVIQDGDASPPFLAISRESIQFNRDSDHSCDLFEFEALLSGCKEHATNRIKTCIQCMKNACNAVALYKGPFLADFSLSDSAEFEDWAEVQRERIQQTALSALNDLTLFHTKRGEYEQAIVYGQQQIKLEPWNEKAHQHLMRLFARVGRRTHALAQYQSCMEMLKGELDVGPSAETVALHDQVAKIEEARAYNLPHTDEIFIGRRDEVARIYEHFTDDVTRLQTLVGGGGIGKTRLALEVGWRIATEHLGPFMHGVYFVSLATMRATSDPEKTLSIALADSLGLSLVGVQSPLDIILGHLQDKELLLIVDNCEEAGDTIELLSMLLNHASGLQILATSREPLNLPNEFLIRLDGLPFPPVDFDMASPAFMNTLGKESLPNNSANLGEKVDAVQLETYHSVQLFSHHARRADADFFVSKVEQSELQGVARICQICEGMPLALEMAAVWVQLLPCQEIAAEIEQNLDTLQSSNREHQPRHRSIRAVFDYSWLRLTEAERTLFARLSVFQGGFDLAAAQDIAEAKLSILASLVRKSLLRYVKAHSARDGKANMHGRYAFHPLLHQYATEKLTIDSVEEVHVQQRHGVYYCTWLHKQTPLLKGRGQQEATATIALDFDNVRQAWQWAVDTSNQEAIGQAVDGLTNFCELRGLSAEGQMLLGAAVKQLQLVQHINEDDATAVVIAKTLARQGWMNFLLGESALAQIQINEALDILQVLEVTEEMVTPLNSLAYVAYGTDQYLLAVEKSERAREIAEMQGDCLGQANALRIKAAATQYQGHLQDSIDQYEQALALYQQIGNGQGACWSLLSLCTCISNLGDFDRAIERGKEVIQLCREIGYRLGEGWAVFGLGSYYVMQSEYTEATAMLKQALHIGHEMCDRRLQASVLHWQGICLRSQEQLDQAQVVFQEALAIFRDIANSFGEGKVLNDVGILERYANHYNKSLALHQQALDIGQRIENQELRCRTFTCLGHAYVAMKRYIQAQTAYEQALECVDEVQPRQKLHPLLGLAYIAAQAGKIDEATLTLSALLVILDKYSLNGAEESEGFFWLLSTIKCAADAMKDEKFVMATISIAESFQHSHPNLYGKLAVPHNEH